MGIDKVGIDEVGIDEVGRYLFFYCPCCHDNILSFLGIRASITAVDLIQPEKSRFLEVSVNVTQLPITETSRNLLSSARF